MKHLDESNVPAQLRRMGPGIMMPRQETEKFLTVFHGDAEKIEINLGGKVPKFCTNVAQAVEAAHSKKAQASIAVYFVVNPIVDSLVVEYRAACVAEPNRRTCDAHILEYRWILIDLDPVRPGKVCSTHAEKRRAFKVAGDVADYLEFAQGWPAPVKVDSGNGYHLYYPCKLPNDRETAETIKRLLLALDTECGTDQVNVDNVVFNAGRLMRVPGTMNRKGDDMPDRPHRLVKLLSIPDDVRDDLVTFDQVLEIAGPVPPPKEHTTEAGDLDVESYFDEVGLEAIKTKELDEFTLYELKACPFDASHDRGEASFTWGKDNGPPGFSCKHHSCADNKVPEFFAEVGAPSRKFFIGETAADHFDAIDDTPSPGEALFDTPGDRSKPARTRITFRTITCAEMAADDSEIVYLVDDILAEGQPMMIGGVSKTLKTSIMIDMGVSLATGTPFLDKFETVESRVGFMSAESGMKTLRGKTDAVCRSRSGLQLSDITNLVWCEQVPNLLDSRHQAGLEDWITSNGLDVLAIDPTYLALPAADIGNVFSQGETLRAISQICQTAKTTLVLLHHAKKTINHNRPIELNDLSGAGFAEFVRQWILINRRERFEASSGTHHLWLNYGGSAGHAGINAADIFEGVKPTRDAVIADPALKKWRKWTIELMDAEAIQAMKQKEKAAVNVSERESRREAIKKAFEGRGDPVFKTEIAGDLGWDRTSTKFKNAWAGLENEGRIVSKGKKFEWSREFESVDEAKHEQLF